MATAPRPGTTSDSDSDGDVGDRVIVVRGVRSVLRTRDYGPRDDELVRRETYAALEHRKSLMTALQELYDEESMGLDSICLLWWFGRRKAGETEETYAEALDGFPTYGELRDEIRFERVVADDDEGEEGSPEG